MFVLVKNTTCNECNLYVDDGKSNDDQHLDDENRTMLTQALHHHRNVNTIVVRLESARTRVPRSKRRQCVVAETSYCSHMLHVPIDQAETGSAGEDSPIGQKGGESHSTNPGIVLLIDTIQH